MSAKEYGFDYPPGEKPNEMVMASFAAMQVYGQVRKVQVTVQTGKQILQYAVYETLRVSSLSVRLNIFLRS